MRKITKILLIISIFITLYSNISLADTISLDDIWGVGQSFIELGIEQNEGNTDINPDAKNAFEFIIDFLWSLGLLTIFICTVVLGIKYMFVLPAERSRIKQATTPYIIGVIIIFGALTIWKFLINILDVNI